MLAIILKLRICAIVATTRLESGDFCSRTIPVKRNVISGPRIRSPSIFYKTHLIQMWKIIQRDEITIILLLA